MFLKAIKKKVPLASWLLAYGRGHFKAGPGSLKRRAIEKAAVAQGPE